MVAPASPVPVPSSPDPDDRLVLPDAVTDPTGRRRRDQVAAFRPAILGIRGGTTAVSVALSASQFGDTSQAVVVWCTALVAYNVFRVIRPVRVYDDTSSLLRIIGEVAIHVLAVVATGYWDSPLVFSLLTAIMVAGFARGFAFAVRIGAVSALAVALPDLSRTGFELDDFRTSIQWTSELLLVALIAGYARRVTGEADRQHSLALDRLGRLSDANALLFSLHRVAQSLPASLDLDEVLDSTMQRVRDLFRFDTAVLLLHDDSGGGWEVVRCQGTRPPARIDDFELPKAMRIALLERRLVSTPDLTGARGPGLLPGSRSGVYAILPARESIVGMLVLEHGEARHFTDRDVELMTGFVEPAGLAVDNARWFARLRTVGADEERTRIARDLHDRIGQSLAYLAFELDRMVRVDGKGEEVTLSLERLRKDVRAVIGEVRDTLYDLRTDVSETQDVASTLEAYLERVHERSGLEVELVDESTGRLPLLQEREFWRVAQEAVTNVERHAHAARLEIRWWCDGTSAVLQVIDDGRGFAPGQAGRLDSYGILGMRERAASIGATLDIDSVEGQGATVRCLLLSESLTRGRS
jgi:signal transduction histidine kinase